MTTLEMWLLGVPLTILTFQLTSLFYFAFQLRQCAKVERRMRGLEP